MLRNFILLLTGVLLANTLIVRDIPTTSFTEKEVLCLAKNIYHEARGESYRGQLAVAVVTLNRVNSKKYSNNICGVVYERKQFSWTLLKKRNITDMKAWNTANSVAIDAISKYSELKQFKATHYHHVSINPKWKLTKVAKIGNHIFYA